MMSFLSHSDRKTLLVFVIFITAYVSYLISCHYVKAYSDPTHWITMSEYLLYRGTVGKWSTVFAMYLIPPTHTGRGLSQWSEPGAEISLPRFQANGRTPYVTVKKNEFRAPGYRTPPEFHLNGKKTEVLVQKGPGEIVEYVLSGLDWSGEHLNRLEFAVRAFNPKKALNSGDDRDLGINIVGVGVHFE